MLLEEDFVVWFGLLMEERKELGGIDGMCLYGGLFGADSYLLPIVGPSVRC